MTDIFDLIGDSFEVEFSETQTPSGGGGGVSPTIDVAAIDGGHRVTVTDVNGVTSFDVLDGTSPTVEVTAINGGHRVTVTDANGTASFDVMNGTAAEGGSDTATGSTSSARGILSFERTAGSGAAGTEDTYTITYTDGTSSTFTVYNGCDGADGSDGEDGTDASVTKEAVEAVLTGDITSHSHSKYLSSHQDVSGKLDKSGGTMTGILKAYNNTGYTTMQVRNIALLAEGASAPTGGNGDLYFVYA